MYMTESMGRVLCLKAGFVEEVDSPKNKIVRGNRYVLGLGLRSLNLLCRVVGLLCLVVNELG